MIKNYLTIYENVELERGNYNWYHLCSAVIRDLSTNKLIPGDTEKEKLEVLDDLGYLKYYNIPL